MRWFRRRIRRGVTRRLVALVVSTTLAVAGVAQAGGWLPPELAAPIGVAIGSALASAWFVTAMFTNPLDLRYLRAYLGEDVEIERPDDAGAGEPTAVRSRRFCYSIEDETAGGATVFDVHAAGHLIISRARASGATVFYSRLADGRAIVTDRQLTAPRTGWMLHPVRDDDAATRLRQHCALLDRIAERGVPVDPAPDPGIVIEHLSAERASYRELGSILGCFVDVDGDRRRSRLAVDVAAAELLALPADGGDGGRRRFVRRVRVRSAGEVPSPTPVANAAS
ncbi:MAG: hypothetical protein AAGA99_26455 [Actinomycetota bacterium]